MTVPRISSSLCSGITVSNSNSPSTVLGPDLNGLVLHSKKKIFFKKLYETTVGYIHLLKNKLALKKYKLHCTIEESVQEL
jgi:hypothetical protein